MFLSRESILCRLCQNAIYEFNGIPIKLPISIFREAKIKHFAIHVNAKSFEIAKTILKREIN